MRTRRRSTASTARSPINLGDWLDVQFAANYEFHDIASSFNPKVAARVNLSESDNHQLALRGSLQSTFRVPSVDDVNTDQITALEYVQEVDVYKAVDTRGSEDLDPETALTGNVGLILFHYPSRTQATFDFWSYDFRDVINVIPHASITRLYHEGGASRDAIKELVKCPDGWGTGTCSSALIERIRINLTNWPGMQTSGFDWSVATASHARGRRDLARPGRHAYPHVQHRCSRLQRRGTAVGGAGGGEAEPLQSDRLAAAEVEVVSLGRLPPGALLGDRQPPLHLVL